MTEQIKDDAWVAGYRVGRHPPKGWPLKNEDVSLSYFPEYANGFEFGELTRKRLEMINLLTGNI